MRRKTKTPDRPDATDISLIRPQLPERVPTHPQHILGDEGLVNTIEEYAKLGASIGTIEAKLLLRPGTLRRWLDRGRKRSAPPECPYRRLYEILRSYAADARLLAEATLRERRPDQWLIRNTLTQYVEASPDAQAPTRPITQGNTSPDAMRRLTKTLPGALAVLQQQGYIVDTTPKPIEHREVEG